LIAGLLTAVFLAVRFALARDRGRDALKEAERRVAALHAVVAAAPGSYWAWPVSAPAQERGTGGQGFATMLGGGDGGFETFDDVVRAFAPRPAGDLRDNVAALRATGTPFTLTIGGIAGDTASDSGYERTFEVHGARSTGPDGKVGFDAVWFRDISKTKQTEAELKLRVEELASLSAEYRNTLERIAIPVWVRGPGLALVYCNRAFADAVEEASPAAAVAGCAEIAGGPTGWGRNLAEEAQRTGAPVTRSAYVVAGGERRFMEITEVPIGGASSNWQVMGFAIDRTDAEEVRGDLSRHMMAHGEVLERLGTGIVIFGADTHVQFANTAFARMWGLDDEWFKAAPAHGEVLEDLRARRVYPDHTDFQAFKREVMELYTSLIEPRENLLHLPDERVFREVVNAHPFGGLLVTYEDVTDRLALERSYNTLIAVQSETLDNLHEGVVVFGADGRIRLSNPGYARIWKLDAQTLRGEPRLADIIEAARDLFIYEGSWETFRDKILAGVMDRTPRMGRFERADDSVIDYAAVPLPDGAMMFSYVDVTDTVSVQRALAERNEALLAADRLKSEFITNVSYELRTPLNSIIGFTEILSNQYFGALNQRQAGYTENILQASRVLLSLIDNILDLALIDAGRLEIERGNVDIRSMMEAVEGLARAQKREVSLEIDCPEDIGGLIGDERRLKQALFNLVINAIAHTPAQGHISLSVRRRDGAVEFSVTDTGQGIAEADIDRVLGRFETGQGAAERGKGLGLGLALVKSFVELHGGSLVLASAPGEGTTVSFDVPTGPTGPAGQGSEADPAS
jgi:signal transduction histidine kinase